MESNYTDTFIISFKLPHNALIKISALQTSQSDSREGEEGAGLLFVFVLIAMTR